MKYLIGLILILSFSIANAVNQGFSTAVVTLAVADVRQTIFATTTRAFDFIIQNPSTNVVSVFLGGSDVTTSGATLGIEIAPGSSIALASTKTFRTDKTLTLLSSANIFLVSTGTSIPVVIGRITK